MTLEELKQAYDDAVAKAKADPTNKELQVAEAKAKEAYEAAKAEAEKGGKGGKGDGGTSDEFDENTADEKTKAYIKKLRDEAAGHRTKAKDLKSQLTTEQERKKAILKAAGIEEDDASPEEKLKITSSEKDQLAFRNAILEQALDHDVPKDKVKYFTFLINEKAAELQDGEELTDEQIAEIAKEAKGSGGGKGNGNTSVNGGKGNGGGTPPPAKEGTITLDKFCKMSLSQKDELYRTNKALYEELSTEAKAQRRLV